MTVRRLLAVVMTIAGLLIGSAGIAHADAPPPFGFWISQDGLSQLLVDQSAQCSLGYTSGEITTSGPCSWLASSNGGILTIISQQTFQPSPVRFNIVYADPPTSMTVWGEWFYLRQ